MTKMLKEQVVTEDLSRAGLGQARGREDLLRSVIFSVLLSSLPNTRHRGSVPLLAGGLGASAGRRRCYPFRDGLFK